MKHFLSAVILVTAIILIPSAADARGSLVKSTELPAVYYLPGDGTRWVFPNEAIYKSWYADFGDVVEVSPEELASYGIGGNVTYRPGTRLVKLTNNPKVYAVEPGGLLRWVTEESVALELYGANWAKRVDDLPDTFFGAYTVGADLANPTHPEGTLLKDRLSDTFYLIENGLKRRVNDEYANGLQPMHAIETDVDKYPDGSELTGEETEVADTAQLNVSAGHKVGVSLAGQEEYILADAENVVLGAFTFNFQNPTDIRELKVTINADSSEGLIQGATPVFTNVHLEDASGKVVSSEVFLSSNEEKDDTQTIILTSSKRYTPGRHLLKVVADTSATVESDETYHIVLNLEGSSFMTGKDTITDIAPTTITAPEVMVKTGKLLVSLSSGLESNYVIEGHADPIDINGFSFTNTSPETVQVSQLSVTGYIDEGEEDDDFLIGGDNDDATTTFVKDIVKEVSLIRAIDGAVLGSALVSSTGEATFSNIFLEIGPDQAAEVLIRGTVEADAPFEIGADRIAFDILAPADDVIAGTLSGLEITADGVSPNGGAEPNITLTVANFATVTVSGVGEPVSDLVMGTDDNLLYTMTISASEEEDVRVNTLAFRMNDSLGTRSLASLTAKWDALNGETQKTANVNSGNIVFENLELLVPKAHSIDVHFYGTIKNSHQGATSGDKIGVSFDNGSFHATGMTSGHNYLKGDLNKQFIDETAPGKDATLRMNMPVIESAESQPSGTLARDIETPLLRFTMKSIGEGMAEIKKLTFKLTTSDIGETGSENDFFEHLAEINGDFQDDNDVFELVHEGAGTTLGEGSDGDIDFFIFNDSAGALDETPSDLDTDSGDYAVGIYEFTTPLRLSTDAQSFLLNIDARKLADGPQSIQATLLEGDDFGWTDGATAFGTQNGDAVNQLPVVGDTINFE